MMTRWAYAAVVLAVVAAVLPVSAGQQVIPSTTASALPPKGGASARKEMVSTIHGVAVYSNRAPVANVTLRLRNLVTGQIEQLTTSDVNGEFSFFLENPAGSYVVELLDDESRLLAVKVAFPAQAIGETIGTMVVVPTRVWTLMGLFGNSAGAIVSAAASTGITAVTVTTPDQSPEK